jgi:hypothetical protein
VLSASFSTISLLAKLLQLPSSIIIRQEHSLIFNDTLALEQRVSLILLRLLHLCTKHTLHNETDMNPLGFVPDLSMRSVG